MQVLTSLCYLCTRYFLKDSVVKMTQVKPHLYFIKTNEKQTKNNRHVYIVFIFNGCVNGLMLMRFFFVFFLLDDPLRLVTRSGYMRLVPHLLQLLREFLLSHQWQEAIKVLHGLTRDHRDTATTIWKV